jgi:hypothetical protein
MKLLVVYKLALLDAVPAYDGSIAGRLVENPKYSKHQ